MSNVNCNSCEDLRQESPNLIVNGLGDTECTSLKNNTGLNPSSGNDDCEDLNNLNDCLVGNMEAEVDSYDVCDWKSFMKKFIPNVWTTLKGIICAVCGLWDNMADILNNIDDILHTIDQLSCIIGAMGKGATFEVDEEPLGKSYVVAGKGCSFLAVSGGGHVQHVSDISLKYIGGGLAILDGSCMFHTDGFTEPDGKTCVNFDNGSTERTSNSRSGNSVWSPSNTGKTATGGELVYEMRIKKSEYPQIKEIFQGRGQETSGGAFTAGIFPFNEGEYAWGQHGWCNATTGQGVLSSYDDGHKVPAGWLYIQCRLSWINLLNDTDTANGHQFTPYCWVPLRLNAEEIEC